MFRNYLISSLRNFLNNKVFSFIYLVGLALGITSCLIIFLFVENELKFDRHHPDYERTYRVTHLFKMPQSDDFTALTQAPSLLPTEQHPGLTEPVIMYTATASFKRPRAAP